MGTGVSNSILISIVFLFSVVANAENIAVLPFDNISKNSEMNWMGIGFSETLMTKLANSKAITVLERNQLSKILEEIKFEQSGMVDENSAVKAGKMFGVNVMVLGSYQVVGDNLRVDARFVNVETRKVLNTAEATGKISDIFKLQDQIAFGLINDLKIPMAEYEKEQLQANPTESLVAYSYFCKGMDEYEKQNYAGAIAYFNEAIKSDFGYADAYFMRGLAKRWSKTKMDVDSYFDVIRDWDSAIDFNPTDALFYCTRGLAKYELAKYNPDYYESAIKDCNRSIELEPKNTLAYYIRGSSKFGLKDFQGAIQDCDKALEISPNDTLVLKKRASAKAAIKDYRGEIVDYNQIVQIDQNDGEIYCFRGVAKFMIGDKKGAIADFSKSEKLGYEDASILKTKVLGQ